MIIYIWCILKGMVPNVGGNERKLQLKQHVRHGRSYVVPIVKRTATLPSMVRSYSTWCRSVRNATRCSKDVFKCKLDEQLSKIPDEPQIRTYTAWRRANSNRWYLCSIPPGTTIVSDLWRAYNTIGMLGYNHLTVNHSENFVDPVTGGHINLVDAGKTEKQERMRYCEGVDRELPRRIYVATSLWGQSVPKYYRSYTGRVSTVTLWNV